MVAGEPAAERRSHDEAETEGGLERAKRSGTLLPRGDVAHIRLGGGDRRSCDAGKDAADEQEPERRGKRHQDVVEPQAEVGKQHNGPAPEAVRKRPKHRGKEELHGGEDGAEQADERRRPCSRAPGKALDEMGQHRRDHPEGQHVEGDGKEDEDDSRTLPRRHLRRFRRGVQCGKVCGVTSAERRGDGSAIGGIPGFRGHALKPE